METSSLTLEEAQEYLLWKYGMAYKTDRVTSTLRCLKCGRERGFTVGAVTLRTISSYLPCRCCETEESPEVSPTIAEQPGK